ncbi:hypothetical protein AnigIFM60653_003421 [Aspergillus niger]|nr:hypothetical protein AnigIFM50267_003198 [Aspergillus niger]GKZ99216.1 hypothetical protein AnigIFM60653_003421 [Aspergillus niger]
MLAENPAIGESGLEAPPNLILNGLDHLDQLAGSMKANADFSSMPPSAHSSARKDQLDWQNCLQTETESTAELLKHPEIEAVLYEHHINRERPEPIQENMLFGSFYQV